MLKPSDLIEKNIEALLANNYSIDEIIQDANDWFNDLIVPVSICSRGYKIACKKLADEVLSLRKQLQESKRCQKTLEKLSTQAALSAASSVSSSVFSFSSESETKTGNCKASSSLA